MVFILMHLAVEMNPDEGTGYLEAENIFLSCGDQTACLESLCGLGGEVTAVIRCNKTTFPSEKKTHHNQM